MQRDYSIKDSLGQAVEDTHVIAGQLKKGKLVSNEQDTEYNYMAAILSVTAAITELSEQISDMRGVLVEIEEVINNNEI